MKKNKYDIQQGKVIPVFFYYTIPTIISLVVMSSAGIVDGIFLGNYVGSTALAAVNLTIPMTSFLIGIGLMLSIGGSVRSGKYMGEGRLKDASYMFTKTLAATMGGCGLIAILGLYFMDTLVLLLGADDTLSGLVGEYLSIILIFSAFLYGTISLYYFVRLDDRPVMAAYAVILASLLNIVFDWLFIGYFEMGIKGAAKATVLSHLFGFLMLFSHFFRKDARLKLLWKKDGWGELLHAAYNGFSEFTNEISAGIVVLLFNLIMIRKMGVSGVAAFTIINYLIYVGLMSSYGVSDSLQPIISKNFGAQNPGRISQFLKVAFAMLITNGIILVMLFICIPETLVHFFISSEETETINIALRFMSLFWPAFLFSGINIALSAYFTAMHKPLHSASVALFRSLILPGTFVLMFPLLLGESGIFLAIPVAEVVTFMLAVALLYYNTPNQLVKAEYQTESDVI